MTDFQYIPPTTQGTQFAHVGGPAEIVQPAPSPEVDLRTYFASRRAERGERITVVLDDELTIHALPYQPAGTLVDGVLSGDDARYGVEFIRSVLAPGEWEALRAWMDRAEVDEAGFSYLGQRIIEEQNARPTSPSSTSR